MSFYHGCKTLTRRFRSHSGGWPWKAAISHGVQYTGVAAGAELDETTETGAKALSLHQARAAAGRTTRLARTAIRRAVGGAQLMRRARLSPTC